VGFGPGAASSPHLGKSIVTSRSRNSESIPDGAKCSHCGQSNHTSATCFLKNGYPDWWYDLQAKKKKNSGGAETNIGTVAVMSAEPHLSLVPQVKLLDADPVSDIGKIGSGFAISSSDGNRNAWLLDSATTDHMTFDDTDFTTRSTLRRTCVENANGVVSPVTGAGIVSLSPSLQLSHTLLIPSLSY
jgi:hypothetical protein